MKIMNLIIELKLLNLRDWLQIILLAAIIWRLLCVLSKTRLMAISIAAIISLSIGFFISFFFKLTMFQAFFVWICKNILPIAIIIFQPEIRHFFTHLWLSLSHNYKIDKQAEEIVNACVAMSQNKCGALIVIERKLRLIQQINYMIPINADVNAELLKSIFYPNSPLHDGAVIISNGKIIAAQAILPLSKQQDLPSSVGTRHRAAIGISEESDAIAIIVSEENGYISLAENGKLHRDLNKAGLLQMLSNIDDREEMNESLKIDNEEEFDSSSLATNKEQTYEKTLD